jgi:tetratricopeptide (TPR) repeat protein
MSWILKVFFIFLTFIPLVHAIPLATTQATATTPAEIAEKDSAPQDKSPEVPQGGTLASERKLSFEDYFGRGTKNYQDKKFEDAIFNFEKALDLHPENTTLLIDLGLSYFQVHKKGLSIAMFRRALFVDPSQTTAEAALKFALSQLEVKEIPHQIGAYERLRSTLLNSVSINRLHLLTALLLFTSGFVWLRYLGRRRKAFELELAPPGTPFIGLLLSVSLTLSTFFTALKIYDLAIPRATVITDKTTVQTAPGDGQSGLFDLYAGFEVIVRNVANDWIQVSYPGGLTGWIKKDSLMGTSGKNAF